MIKISIIMGIYNCADTLLEAVDSILKQTYTNWELLMCDDGSTDETYSVAKQIALSDKRIILIQNPKNLGLNKTLNHCLERATGEYIARMDADDICVPERLEKQLNYLMAHPDISIVSSAMSYFDESGIWGQTGKRIEFPTKENVVAGSPICHAPAMLRAECYKAISGYSTKRYTMRVEDVDLWIRLYEVGYKAYNFIEPLYCMRNDKNAFARRKYKYRVNSTIVRLRGCFKLKLSAKCYFKAFRPMLVGLFPSSIRRKYRERKSKEI